MLVLSRKTSEEILIGDNVKIIVVRIDGKQVRLGIEAPRDVSITRPDAVKTPGMPRSESEGPLRVLVIDDSPEDRTVYRRMLNVGQEGFVVLEAESGTDGIEACRSQAPDCVLLDYLLPDMTGLEFLEELCGANGETMLPVVMLTGQGDESVAVQALKGGARDYIVKRLLTSERLRGTIRDAVQESLRVANRA